MKPTIEERMLEAIAAQMSTGYLKSNDFRDAAAKSCASIAQEDIDKAEGDGEKIFTKQDVINAFMAGWSYCDPHDKDGLNEKLINKYFNEKFGINITKPINETIKP